MLPVYVASMGSTFEVVDVLLWDTVSLLFLVRLFLCLLVLPIWALSPVPFIPRPRGDHAVHFYDFWLQDADEETEGIDHDGVGLRVWWPRKGKHAESTKGYVPLAKEYVAGLASFSELPKIVFSSMDFVNMPAAQANPKKADEELAEVGQPVVILSHGLGGFRSAYAALATELASHGYVVLAVEHNDSTACTSVLPDRKVRPYRSLAEAKAAGEDEFAFRNGQIVRRADEIDLAIRAIRGADDVDVLPAGFIKKEKSETTLEMWKRVRASTDDSRIAMVGHSFGAATTMDRLARDERIMCGVALDVWMFPLEKKELAGLACKKPLLALDSDGFRWADNVNEKRDVVAKWPRARTAVMHKTMHQNFSDFPVFNPYVLRRLKMAGDMDPVDALRQIADVVLRFVDVTTSKDSAAANDWPSQMGTWPSAITLEP